MLCKLQLTAAVRRNSSGPHRAATSGAAAAPPRNRGSGHAILAASIASDGILLRLTATCCGLLRLLRLVTAYCGRCRASRPLLHSAAGGLRDPKRFLLHLVASTTSNCVLQHLIAAYCGLSAASVPCVGRNVALTSHRGPGIQTATGRNKRNKLQ